MSCVCQKYLYSLQGAGRYAIYIANYASGNVGPHALIEMDESASDLSQGVIALTNVAEQAGVNKLTGMWGLNFNGRMLQSFGASSFVRPSVRFFRPLEERVLVVPKEAEIWVSNREAARVRTGDVPIECEKKI